MSCKICGGPMERLGRMGDLMHYRCQNCGMMSAKKTPRRKPANKKVSK